MVKTESPRLASPNRFRTYGGLSDPLVANQLAMAVNALQTSRSQLMRALQDPRRSIDDECGYPQTQELIARDYKHMYDRLSVATRVVQVVPMESWKVPPTVFETEDVDQVTAFEESWDVLGKNLRGESWYQDEEGSIIWEYLLRADVLSGIGAYGILLLGLDDGRELSEEATFGKKEQKLLFLRTFDESLAQITQLESDKSNPRFGQPTRYSVTFTDPQDQPLAVIGGNISTQDVHWSRVVHLADNLGSSEIAGPQRQRPVWNRLLDLRKLYGAMAEMYWRGAFMGLSFESHPQLGGDVLFDPAELRDQLENYQNTLQRNIVTTGFHANPLAPQIVDPTPQIDAQIKAICIQIGVPKRVFEGSELGKLAADQDSRAWDGRLKHRQLTYVTPRIIVPFVDRLIMLGVLPEPVGYSVTWPDLTALTEAEQAAIGLQRTEALVKYIGGNGEAVVHPLDFLVRFLHMDAEEAQAMIDLTMKTVEPMIPVEEEETFEEGGGKEETGNNPGHKNKEKK